jgi:hypothetical protein
MEGADMKQQTKPESGAAGLVAFGVTCAVILGLSGLYFGGTEKPAPKPRPQHAAPARALAARGAMPDAPVLPAPSPRAAPLPRSEPAAPSPLAAEEPAPEPEPGNLPAPTPLPETTSNPAPEAAQDPAWKAEKTKAISQVVSSRAERLQRDIAKRERTGDVKGAAELRVLAARLQKQQDAMDGELKELALAPADKPL